jgi:hypothetical protein
MEKMIQNVKRPEQTYVLIKALEEINKLRLFKKKNIDEILLIYEKDLLGKDDKNATINDDEIYYYYKKISKLSSYEKCKWYVKKYNIFSLLLAMKIVSKNNIPNEAYTKGVYEVDRVAGKFKIIYSMSVSTNLEEKPWVDLHLFSNIEPVITYTKIEPFQNQDLSNLDFHTCLVKKHTYALGKGGDYICGGCGYQQDFIKNTNPTNLIYDELANWTNSLMSPFELEKYLNLVLENIK